MRRLPLADAPDNAQTVHDLFEILEPLRPLSRATSDPGEALRAAREHAREDPLLIAAREEVYEISGCFDMLFADAKLALDYRIAQSAEAQMAKATEMAAAQHRLNTLAAATFPLMAVDNAVALGRRRGWIVAFGGSVLGFRRALQRFRRITRLST